MLQEDDNSRRKGRQIFATKRRQASGGDYCRAPMQLLATTGRGESKAQHLMVRDSMMVSLMNGTL